MFALKKNIYFLGKFIHPLLKLTAHHTKHSMWGGIDGMKYELKDNPLLLVLKEWDEELYNAALDMILEKIIKETESHLEDEVLQGFVKTYPKKTLQFITTHHQFMEKYPHASRVCNKVIDSIIE